MKIIVGLVLASLAVLSAADQTGLSIAADFCSLNNIQNSLLPLILPNTPVENGTLVDSMSFGNWLGELTIKNLKINPLIDFTNVKRALAWSNETTIYYQIQNLEVNLEFDYEMRALIIPIKGSGKVNASQISATIAATYVPSQDDWNVVFVGDVAMGDLQITLSDKILSSLVGLFEGWIKSQILGVVPGLVDDLNNLIKTSLDSTDPRRMPLALTTNVAFNFTFSTRPVMDQVKDYALVSFNGLVYNNITLKTYAPNRDIQPTYYENAWREQVHLSDDTFLSAIFALWSFGQLPGYTIYLNADLSAAFAKAYPEFQAKYGDGASYALALELVPPFDWTFENGIAVNAQGMYATVHAKQTADTDYSEAATFSFFVKTKVNPYSNSNYILTSSMASTEVYNVKVVNSEVGPITPNATLIAGFVDEVETFVNGYAGYNLAALVPPEYSLATMLLNNVTIATNQTAGYLLLGLNYNTDSFIC